MNEISQMVEINDCTDCTASKIQEFCFAFGGLRIISIRGKEQRSFHECVQSVSVQEIDYSGFLANLVNSPYIWQPSSYLFLKFGTTAACLIIVIHDLILLHDYDLMYNS